MDFMAEGVYYSSACKRCSRNAALALESGNLSGSKAPVYSSDRYRQRVVNSNFVELVSPSFPSYRVVNRLCRFWSPPLNGVIALLKLHLKFLRHKRCSHLLQDLKIFFVIFYVTSRRKTYQLDEQLDVCIKLEPFAIFVSLKKAKQISLLK